MTLGMVCLVSWLLQRPGLRAPYSTRTSGKRGEAFSSRGSWDTPKGYGPSKHHAHAVSTSASVNVFVSD